ncbi:7918_t:CDS:1, partial [Entrophospora sp. SA101]
SATNIPESSHSDSNEIISQDETGKIRKKTGVEHKKGEGLDKLKHELFVSETSQEPSIEQNLVNEISETLCPGKITFDNISSIDEASQHLAQLCNKAFDAEDKANRANQEEILCWYLYAKDFRIQLNGIIETSEGKFGEKKARSLLYDSITKQLNLIRKQRSQELGLQLRDISRD